MILIFWRRWGPVGLLFLVAGFLLWVALAVVIPRAMQITPTPGSWNVFALVLGFGAGAFANWLFAVKVVEPRLDRPHAVPPPPSSTLYFLRLRHWTWVIVGIGVVFLVPNLIAAITA